MFGIYTIVTDGKRMSLRNLLVKHSYQSFRNSSKISEYVMVTSSSLTYFSFIELFREIQRELLTLREVKNRVIYSVLACPHTQMFHKIMAFNHLACEYFHPCFACTWSWKWNCYEMIVGWGLRIVFHAPVCMVIHIITLCGILIASPYILLDSILYKSHDENKEHAWIHDTLKAEKLDDTIVFKLISKTMEKFASKVSGQHAISVEVTVSTRRKRRSSNEFLKVWGFQMSDSEDEELAQTSVSRLLDLRNLLDPKDKGRTQYRMYEFFD